MHDLIREVFAEFLSAWRFRWYGMIAAWLVCLGGWTFVAFMPNVYEAGATVFVDASSALDSLLEDQIVLTDVAEQLNYIREELLGRQHLEEVATANGILDEVSTVAEIERAIGALRRNVVISQTQPDNVGRNQSQRSPNSIFNISFQNNNRERAIGVVASLTSSLVSGTLDANEENAEAAGVFLDDQIRISELELQAAEEARMSFQQANAERLPGTSGSFFEQMQDQRDELVEIRRELRLAESRRDSLREQRDSENPVLPLGVLEDNELDPNSIDGRIRALEAQIDQLALQYTDRHPNLRNAREALELLKAQRSERLAELGIGNEDQELAQLGANPIYEAIQIALNEVETEIATYETDIAEREARLNELLEAMNEVREVERQWTQLNREYEAIEEHFQTLVRRRQTQDLTRQAEEADAIRFDVLNPPFADFSPVSPPRLQLFLLVFLGGVGGGAGLAYLLSRLKPVFGSTQALRQMTELPVFGAISQADMGRRHVLGLPFGVAGVSVWLLLLGVLFLGTIAVELIGPGWQEVIRGT